MGKMGVILYLQGTVLLYKHSSMYIFERPKRQVKNTLIETLEM